MMNDMDRQLPTRLRPCVPHPHACRCSKFSEDARVDRTEFRISIIEGFAKRHTTVEARPPEYQSFSFLQPWSDGSLAVPPTAGPDSRYDLLVLTSQPVPHYNSVEETITLWSECSSAYESFCRWVCVAPGVTSQVFRLRSTWRRDLIGCTANPLSLRRLRSVSGCLPSTAVSSRSHRKIDYA